MRTLVGVVFVLPVLLATAGLAWAGSVEVRVGQDDARTGTAYLRYYPETVVVRAGDTVNWTAASDTPHTVTANPGTNETFDSSPTADLGPLAARWFGPGGFLLPAQSFNVTFSQPGNYTYICKIHPTMVGTVTVTNTTAPASNGTVPNATGSLPLGSNGTSRSEPGQVFVAAGWGSGDTTVDRFGPANITVPMGTSVVWTNMHSAEPHTVTGFLGAASPSAPPAFDSSPNVGRPPPEFEGARGVMSSSGQNTLFSHTFADQGTFTYVCKLHPGMVGTVVVMEGPGVPAPPGTTRTGQSGSVIPGFELAIAGLGAALAAAFARRR
jgi:plastocyanin